ncbi:MAG TPA: ribbon-helix-helix domain-containing protein [Coxiellaceae bacterium]|nr:MAG: hypothetical protein A3E81_07065 [Gammaproteobacteria bacterium RIFCSPHIGHO2_12_FULL_36_30]HLB56414.1 ribbon-helix-helix domain-containing protein [Coxiellaceae bacterium]
MIRTQVYITKEEKKMLTQLSKQTGDSQSELIRKAIELLKNALKKKSSDRLQALRAARGIWEGRSDDEFIAIRKSLDRKFKE